MRLPRDYYVRACGNDYSVDPSAIGHLVDVITGLDTVVVTRAGRCLAEHERVWENTPEALDAIAALFTSSPNVVINRVPGSGHNISVGLNADAYHERVLNFVDECIAAPEDSEREAG